MRILTVPLVPFSGRKGQPVWYWRDRISHTGLPVHPLAALAGGLGPLPSAIDHK